MKQTKTLAQIANDLENKNNLHEYCNAESVKIKIGNFESFDAFASYFHHHYAPVLKKVSRGEALTVEESRLLGWFAGEMLDTFKEEPDSDYRISEAETLKNECGKMWLNNARENISERKKAVKNWKKYMKQAEELKAAIKAYNELPQCFRRNITNYQFQVY